MRTFVRLRQILASHAVLARKLETLERKYDDQFKVVFDAIRQLMAPPEKKGRAIGFFSVEPKRRNAEATIALWEPPLSSLQATLGTSAF
jgi:hypothetical protein